MYPCLHLQLKTLSNLRLMSSLSCSRMRKGCGWVCPDLSTASGTISHSIPGEPGCPWGGWVSELGKSAWPDPKSGVRGLRSSWWLTLTNCGLQGPYKDQRDTRCNFLLKSLSSRWTISLIYIITEGNLLRWNWYYPIRVQPRISGPAVESCSVAILLLSCLSRAFPEGQNFIFKPPDFHTNTVCSLPLLYSPTNCFSHISPSSLEGSRAMKAADFHCLDTQAHRHIHQIHPWSVQSQAGWSSDQPGAGWFLRSLPTQTTL